MAFPNTSILDNVNRADNYIATGNSNWVVSQNAGMYIYSNEYGPFSAASDQASTWATSFPADQEVFKTLMTLPGVGFYAQLMARKQANNNETSDKYYLLTFAVSGANNDTQEIYKLVSTVYTKLGATIALGVDLASTNQIGLQCQGTSITAYLNGTATGTRVDSDIAASGYIGTGSHGNSGAVRFDNFGGGAIPTATSYRQTINLLGVGL